MIHFVISDSANTAVNVSQVLEENKQTNRLMETADSLSLSLSLALQRNYQCRNSFLTHQEQRNAFHL